MAWWKYAKPGDEIVCVNDDKLIGLSFDPPFMPIHGLDNLMCGEIYTIRDIKYDEYNVDILTVFLQEIHRDIRGDMPFERGYAIQRFRPLQKRINGDTPILEDA
ncbi:MAG: hypothetical protein GY749_22885 [Desulfobacteraceae bacterium]|nr:hypothetical protein [Desulfobacteraceae bacterium]